MHQLGNKETAYGRCGRSRSLILVGFKGRANPFVLVYKLHNMIDEIT
jgi:hypothetical protein